MKLYCWKTLTLGSHNILSKGRYYGVLDENEMYYQISTDSKHHVSESIFLSKKNNDSGFWGWYKCYLYTEKEYRLLKLKKING